jgi:hypothetical protein
MSPYERGRGVTPSEEVVHISPNGGSTEVGQRGSGPWRSLVCLTAGLIKPARRHDRRGEAAGKLGWRGGVYGAAFKPPQAVGRPTEEMPRFQTGPGKSGRPGL